MLTYNILNTASSHPSDLARRLCFFLTISLLAAVPAYADETAVAENVSRATELPPVIAGKANVYQTCVNSVMSTLEPASVKRQQIADRCGDARDEMVNAFPAQLRPLIGTNTDRRIASVLDALEQIEHAVIESAEDVQEISTDLDALSETTPNEQ